MADVVLVRALGLLPQMLLVLALLLDAGFHFLVAHCTVPNFSSQTVKVWSCLHLVGVPRIAPELALLHHPPQHWQPVEDQNLRRRRISVVDIQDQADEFVSGIEKPP